MSAIGSDDDIPDPLELCPLGKCPWCNSAVSGRPFYSFLATHHAHPYPDSCEWDEDETEDQNRTRYAEEVLDDAYTEGRIIGEQRKYGAGREV